MRTRDIVKFAAGAMADRKIRAALTIIGIVIGPATIVALVAATQGFSNASAAQFEKLGTTTIFVSSTINLTLAELNEIQSLNGVSVVDPYATLSGSINVKGQQEPVQIIATDLVKLEAVIPALTLNSGSLPSLSDSTRAVIGSSIAYPDVSGAANVTLNQVLTVSGIATQNVKSFIGGAIVQSASVGPGGSSSAVTRSFIVDGIYNAFGQGFQINPDGTVFVPLAVAESITHTYTFRTLLVAASSASVVDAVVNEIKNLFQNKIYANAVSSFLSFQQSLSQGIATILETVAGISVLVAFIGIMTTMFTSVLERTKEIGILKALGASGRNIMLTFLSEALVTGFIGGLVGAAAGSALSFLVVILLQGNANSPSVGGGPVTVSSGGPNVASSSLSITPAITPELILAAVVLATIVGMLAGLFPAWRASKLPPVDALRSV